ncbi:MAG TPA: MgtC/SapB family protein, partial [Atopostipes sp.]|nr:MgtC/SapB family protein [Atopostipes sp.]
MLDKLPAEIYELSGLTITFRVVLAIFVGGLIGTERDIKNRAAGIRTHMLVCLGAAVVMMTNQYVVESFPESNLDITRMGAQVVSGIGFLGAGTILVTSHNRIRGLTTAAGLWAAATLGLAIGIGFYEMA